MTVHVTGHAIERYQERVSNVSRIEAKAALSSPFIAKAAEFGAPFVRLGTGQRIVLVGEHVVTVLPTETHPGSLGTYRHGTTQGGPDD